MSSCFFLFCLSVFQGFSAFKLGVYSVYIYPILMADAFMELYTICSPTRSIICLNYTHETIRT